MPFALFYTCAFVLLASRLLFTHTSPPFETNTTIACDRTAHEGSGLRLTITDIHLPHGKQSSGPAGSSHSGPTVVRHPHSSAAALSLSFSSLHELPPVCLIVPMANFGVILPCVGASLCMSQLVLISYARNWLAI